MLRKKWLLNGYVPESVASGGLNLSVFPLSGMFYRLNRVKSGLSCPSFTRVIHFEN